jgi:hypothetical protein
MKKTAIILLAAALTAGGSCNDWLDVRPSEQSSAKELFTSYQGFCDALNGTYMAMKSRSIYGEKLTFGDIEVMGAHWSVRHMAASPQHWVELDDLNYSGDNAETALGEIWIGLYNTVAQANMIIGAMSANGHVITDEATRGVIEGEALAIRAFCHFDVLRIFGQMPRGAAKQVSLPYAEKVSKDDLPPYYTYAQFVQKVEDDLLRAESLLKDNDPLFRYTYAELENSYKVGDAFLSYRQNRFSYYAVKALQARFYLYTGQTGKAYAAARAVIDARGADGNKLISLSGTTDIENGHMSCPGEALMQLNVHDIATYSPSVLAWPAYQVQYFHLSMTGANHTAMFDGYAASNRAALWEGRGDSFGRNVMVLKKYYYPATASTDAVAEVTRLAVVPLLRLSELYLIAVETAPSLDEANALWTEYLASHGIAATPFGSTGEIAAALLKFYHIELHGEGQIFFTYKRLGATTMDWRMDGSGVRPLTVGEDAWVVPLPATEFDPANL